MTRALPLLLLLLLATGPALAAVLSPDGCVTLALAGQAETLAVYPIVGDSIGFAAQAGSAGTGTGLVAFITPALCHSPGPLGPVIGTGALQAAIPILA